MPTNQQKRTGRGTKDSPLTDIQIQDLSNQGINEGDTVAGKGVLRPGGYFDAPVTAPKQGIVTADSASRTVNNARNTLNEIGSTTGPSSTGGDTGGGVQTQLSALYKQLSSFRKQLATSKENEKIAKENLTNVDLQNKLGAVGSSEESQASVDATGAINNINKVAGGDTNVDTSNITDPFIRAQNDAFLNQLNLTQAQITRSVDFAKTMSEYSQAEVDDINATAVRAVERQSKENDRIQRAMEAVGIMGGRAQSAPRGEKSFIGQIIQDGLDRINVIEDNKNRAIRQARQAESEFNYKLFNDSVELAKDYNTQIENEVSQLKADVRQAEKDDQDKLVFNQAQEERSALILAGELLDATDEQIANTASANQIDPYLLLKAVSDAKFEQQGRAFDTANQALTLESKRATINKTNNAIRLANQKDDGSEESRISDEVRRNIMSNSGLSKTDAENLFASIDEFGPDEAMRIARDAGKSKEEVKAIIAGYEKNLLGKDETETSNQTRLNKMIDEYVPNQQNNVSNPTVSNVDTTPTPKKTTKSSRSKLDLGKKTSSNSSTNKFNVKLNELESSSFFKDKPKKKKKKNSLLTS